jgi:alpha-tubulin suppressor-like RCC1 family protein
MNPATLMTEPAMKPLRILATSCGILALLGCSDSTGPVVDEVSFARIASGAKFSCGLDSDGVAYCWGQNDRGQLGDGTTTTRLAPTKVSTTLQFSAIAAGASHTCAITLTGDPYCWGRNERGEAGAGEIGTNQLTPALVGGGHKFVSIAPSLVSTCATTSERDVYCWGHIAYTDNFGTALAGVKTTQPTWIGTGMVAVVAGLASPDGARYCSVDQNAFAYCWMLLYTYPYSGPIIPPIGDPVSTTLRFTTLRIGTGHVCGIATTGQTYCWGLNNLGQLGDGTTSFSSSPTPVIGGHTFESLAVGGGNVILDDGMGISANSGFSCGLTAGGKAYCWGANNRGQLGIGTTASSARIPQPVAGGLTFTALRAGAYHVCGLTSNGSAYCWGDNESGQLGDGSYKPSAKPTPVAGN